MSQNNSKSQLSIIFLTVFIYLLGFGIIIPIIPILSRDFGASATESGLLMSIYSLMQFLFSPFWGRLSDRYGRRPILLFCMFCEGLSYILFAMAKDLSVLFIARGLAGFFGASLSAASAAISDVTEKQERSKGMALIGAAFGLGFVFGPAIGGLLAQLAGKFSTDPLFKTMLASLVVSGICFLNFIFAFFKFKETIKNKSSQVTRRSRFKFIFEGLRLKTVGPLMGIFFLVSLAMASMESTLILYMGKKFNWGVREVSWGFVYIGVMLVLTQGLIVRRLIPKLGERKVLRIGILLFTLGMLGIPVAQSIPLLTVAMTFLSIGNGLTNPSTLGSISLLSASQEQGEKLGITQSLSSLGRILGPPIGGYVFDRWFIQAPFWVSTFFCVVAIFLFVRIFNEIPQSGLKAKVAP